MAHASASGASQIIHADRPAPDQQTATSLERLASDLHGLIFDVQEARTAHGEARNAIEGHRIAAAIHQLFAA